MLPTPTLRGRTCRRDVGFPGGPGDRTKHLPGQLSCRPDNSGGAKGSERCRRQARETQAFHDTGACFLTAYTQTCKPEQKKRCCPKLFWCKSVAETMGLVLRKLMNYDLTANRAANNIHILYQEGLTSKISLQDRRDSLSIHSGRAEIGCGNIAGEYLDKHPGEHREAGREGEV